MKGIAVACALALGVVCISAEAKNPAPVSHAQKWSKEPDGFLGIKFGAPMSVQACPTKVIGESVIAGRTVGGVTTIDFDSVKKLDGVCVNETSSGNFLMNTPDLGFSYGVQIGRNAGSPTDFTMTSPPNDFDALSAAFIARYGQPTSRTKSIAKTIGGATFDNEELQWRGEHVTIIMRKYGDRVDQSETDIMDEDYWGPRERARAESAAAGIGKL